MSQVTLRGTLHGYVFDGAQFQRACVNAQGKLINKVTGMDIDVTPVMVWYTQREFQNAIARVQTKGVKVSGLAVVQPLPELLVDLADNASLRTTRDHLLHMLTAGKEKVLDRKFTQGEIDTFGRIADQMASDLIHINVPQAKTA